MIANPKSVSLCIFLFLASALVTFSFKQTQHGGRWQSARRGKGHLSAQQQIIQTHKVAFATFLAGSDTAKDHTDEQSAAMNDQDDGYFIGTRVLAYQLLHSRSAGTNNSIPFIVMCTKAVSKRKRDRLKADGATVVVVERLDPGWVVPEIERWKDVMTKLRLFQLLEYSKICFVDADTLVTGPLDGVFFDEATLTQTTTPNPAGIKDDEAALPHTYMFASHSDYGLFGFYDHPYPPPPDGTYLNCGFFVFTPSLPLFEYYTSLLKLPDRFHPMFPEQNLLNYAHRRDGNMPWRPLWHGWNVNWPTAKDWRAGAKSFHAKYWDDDPSHDPVLKAIWKEQRAEMEGFYRGRDLAVA